jgi:hypothetical protein
MNIGGEIRIKSGSPDQRPWLPFFSPAIGVRIMPSFTDQSRDAMHTATQSFGAAFRDGGAGYLRYVPTAQPELLQLSANLLQRDVADSQCNQPP